MTARALTTLTTMAALVGFLIRRDSDFLES